MLSLMRIKPEASLLEAVGLACGHSRPGGWCPGQTGIRAAGSRYHNAEGRS
jgi:hypothetical protein